MSSLIASADCAVLVNPYRSAVHDIEQNALNVAITGFDEFS